MFAATLALIALGLTGAAQDVRFTVHLKSADGKPCAFEVALEAGARSTAEAKQELRRRLESGRVEGQPAGEWLASRLARGCRGR